jgi:hypothetical protein
MDARDVKCGCCRRATLNEDALRISAWECPDCHWINPLPGEPITAPPVPAPGDVLAWDEVAGAMQQAAEWLHSYAHGDALVVVPENYRRVAEVLSRASLVRLAARPTPMTDEDAGGRDGRP